MKKIILIIFGFSLGIPLVLWMASIVDILHIPDEILLIQLITHFLITSILYSFFILILPRYLTYNIVKRNTLNQVIVSSLISLFVSITHSIIYDFIYTNAVSFDQESFKAFVITFLFQNIIFIPIIILNNKLKLFPSLHSFSFPKENILKKYEDIISIEGQQSKEKVSFLANELLFIKSSDNYSEFYFMKDNEVKRKVIRLTLKSIEEQVDHILYITRSHKSYIVNLKQDIKITGNANDTKIFIENFSIPVSRSKRNTILETYERIHP